MKRHQDLNSSIKYLEQALIEEEYQYAQENLYYFYKKAWSEIDPEPYVETWVYELISEHLQAQQMGEKDLQNIIINIQPRIGKCLNGTTKITLSNNTNKSIKDIEIGEQVLSTNGVDILKDKVIAKEFTGIKDVYRITLNNGLNLEASEEHRLGHEKEFKAIKDLNIESRLSYLKDEVGRFLCLDSNKIKSIEYIGLKETYDIETEKYNCFFANGILSHNSKLISVVYPAWIWTFRPQEKFLCVSHGDRLVTDLSTGSRTLMLSNWYSSYWVGENKSFQFSRDSNTKTRYDNTKGGSRIGTTPSGQGLGFGYSTLIMDDPNDLMDIYSEAELKKVTDYYKGVLRNRANNPAEAKKVLVQQRIGSGDLTAWIKENEGEKWFHLLIPSEFESKYTFISPIGLNDPRKKEGESVCPERFNEDFYYAEKKDAFKWASLYQQRPAPLEGAVIKNSWIKYAEKIPDVFDFMCISTDLALTDNDESDFCVFTVWGKTQANIFLVDMIRDKMHINDQIQTLKDLSLKYPNARTKLIERRATGDPLMQMLENQVSGLIGINPIGKKVERLYSCVPEFASGKVFFPNPKEQVWVKDVLEELLVFPKSRHDDIVDAVSQAINYLALQSFHLEVTLSENTDNSIAKHREIFTGFASNYSIPMQYTSNRNPFKQ